MVVGLCPGRGEECLPPRWSGSRVWLVGLCSFLSGEGYAGWSCLPLLSCCCCRCFVGSGECGDMSLFGRVTWGKSLVLAILVVLVEGLDLRSRMLAWLMTRETPPGLSGRGRGVVRFGSGCSH
jgi:hypothetical protein